MNGTENTREHPQRDSHDEGEERVLLSTRPLTQTLHTFIDEVLCAFDMLYIGREHLLQDEEGNDEIQDHGSAAPYHPVEECDVGSIGSQLTEESNHDDVRRRANRGEHTTDGASIGRHQHQTSGIFIGRQVNNLTIGSHHLANSLQQTKGDGEHHGSSSGVADPARAEHTGQANGQEDATWRVAHPLHRHDAVCNTFI